MDFVKPGIVDWVKRVNTKEKMSKIPAKKFQQILENCNYAVELGKKLNLVLVGIGGQSIVELFSIDDLSCLTIQDQTSWMATKC